MPGARPQSPCDQVSPHWSHPPNHHSVSWRPESDQVDTDTYTAEPGHQEVLVVGAGAHRAVLNIVEVSANQENHHHLAMAISS